MYGKGLFRRWFPASPDRAHWEWRLAEYYARNKAYHEMTAASDKLHHPQVALLECLVAPDGRYAEIGCGSGKVCGLIGKQAYVSGYDISNTVIENARKTYQEENIEFVCAAAEAIPLDDNSADGVYSFELIEHVWDPVVVIKEMIRITKPGGFILLTAPSFFSLDLHLSKRRLVRTCEKALATLRLAADLMTKRSFHNLVPDLNREPYPDCDMVSSIVPSNFVRTIQQAGCTVDFWDTTYMCSHSLDSTTDLDFQKNTARALVKHFGDHIVILAHKEGGDQESLLRPPGYGGQAGVRDQESVTGE